MTRHTQGWGIVGLGVGLLLGGCAESPERVWVDRAALQAEAGFSVRPAPLPPVPPALPAETFELPYQGETTMADPNPELRGAALRRLEVDRDKALTQLRRRLREVYEEEAARLEAARLSSLRPEQEALLARAQAQIREIFFGYAAQRGPLVARWTVLTLLPEYRPNHSPDARRFVREITAEAQAIEAQLKGLEELYRTEANAILNRVQAQIDRDLTEMRAEIQRLRLEADARADAEATRQILENRSELSLQFAELSPIELAGTQGAEVVVPGVEAPARSPSGAALRSIAETLAPEKLLDRQLAIWLSTENYELASSKSKGRDATEEFRDWRRTITHVGH